MSLWTVCQVESGDAEVFILRWGPSGSTYVAALGLAAAGTVCLTGILDSELGATLSQVCGIFGVALAAGLASYRRLVSIDRAAGVLCESHLFLVPISERSVSIQPHGVRLERRARYNSESATVEYTHMLYLVSRGAPLLTLARTSDGVRADAIANNAARFLDVPLDDRSAGFDAGTGIIARRVSETISQDARRGSSADATGSRRTRVATGSPRRSSEA